MRQPVEPPRASHVRPSNDPARGEVPVRELPEGGGPLPEATRHRLLLQGGNGSGKTTILETIRRLWEMFGVWIEKGPGKEFMSDSFGTFREHMAAMELGGFPHWEEGFWLCWGRAEAWAELKAKVPDARFAGLIWRPEDRQVETLLPPGDWRAFRNRSMVGSEPQPNIVAFGPDDRRVVEPPDGRPHLIDTTGQGWSATYTSGIDLESVLLTVQALRQEDFDRILHLVNLALRQRGKRITGWGWHGRLQVEGTTPDRLQYAHTVDRLSSGERQMLLMIAYVAGFLRPGGIVLIDEPDLHIHLSMVTQLMQTLDLVVRERGAVDRRLALRVRVGFLPAGRPANRTDSLAGAITVSQTKPDVRQAQAILAAGKRVLFVEGKSDQAVYETWLRKLDPLYGSKLEVVEVEGKNALDAALPTLGNPPQAFALCDRDEPDAARITALQAVAPNLLVNAGDLSWRATSAIPKRSACPPDQGCGEVLGLPFLACGPPWRRLCRTGWTTGPCG